METGQHVWLDQKEDKIAFKWGSGDKIEARLCPLQGPCKPSEYISSYAKMFLPTLQWMSSKSYLAFLKCYLLQMLSPMLFPSSVLQSTLIKPVWSQWSLSTWYSAYFDTYPSSSGAAQSQGWELIHLCIPCIHNKGSINVLNGLESIHTFGSDSRSAVCAPASSLSKVQVVLGYAERVWEAIINWRHHVSGDITQRCGAHETTCSSVSTFSVVWGLAFTALWNFLGMLCDPEDRWPLKAGAHFIHDQLPHT